MEVWGETADKLKEMKMSGRRDKEERRKMRETMLSQPSATVGDMGAVQQMKGMTESPSVANSRRCNNQDFVVSQHKFPTQPAIYVSEDAGESWEWGRYVCILQKNPPLLMDALKAMLKRLPLSAIPPSSDSGIRYLYVLSMFYKKGMNPAGRDSSLPAEILTIEQVDTSKFMGGASSWDAPTLCAFQPSGRWNSGRTFASVSKNVAREAFFSVLAERSQEKPVKIGTIQDGVAFLRGESPKKAASKGCLVPIVVGIGTFLTMSVFVCVQLCK